MSVYDVVHQIASSLGVPDRIWQSVVQIESGGNPNAIGDNGTSFGLFQLHVGGQAPSGVPTSQLLDPATNAKYGLPSVASTWNSLKSSFDDSTSWWTKFAEQSGHPGYDPVLASQVAVKLKAAYDANTFDWGNSGTSTPTNSSGSTTGLTSMDGVLPNLGSINDFFKYVNDVLLSTDWVDSGIRFGLIGLGIVLFILALVLIFKDSNG